MACSESSSGGGVASLMALDESTDEKSLLPTILDIIMKQQAAMEDHFALVRHMADKQTELQESVNGNHLELCAKLDRKLGGIAETIPEGATDEVSYDVVEGSFDVVESGKMVPANDSQVVDPFKWKSQRPASKPLESEHNGLVAREEPGRVTRLSGRLRSFVESTSFDIITGAVVGLNMCVMAIDVQLRGLTVGESLGMSEAVASSRQLDEAFAIIEVVFMTVYWIEILLRIWAMRRRFFRRISMLYEFGVVLCSTADMLMTALGRGVAGRFTTLLRLTRLVRVLKIVHVLGAFSKLNVIITTLKNSIATLGWAMLVLFSVIVTSNLFMCQALSDVVADEFGDMALRVWTYERFGTFARGLLTMFEVTFSTAWLNIARKLIFEVGTWHGIFWIAYVIIVQFATIRVLGAMFIKEAMSASSLEEKRIATLQMKRRDQIVDSVRQVFEAADTSGDGSIDKQEFEDLLRRPDVAKLFDVIGLTEDEVYMIFTMLSLDDGMADYEEFLNAAMAMKNTVRNLDMLRISHEHFQLKRQLEDVQRNIRKVTRFFRGKQLSMMSTHHQYHSSL